MSASLVLVRDSVCHSDTYFVGTMSILTGLATYSVLRLLFDNISPHSVFSCIESALYEIVSAADGTWWRHCEVKMAWKGCDHCTSQIDCPGPLRTPPTYELYMVVLSKRHSPMYDLYIGLTCTLT